MNYTIIINSAQLHDSFYNSSLCVGANSGLWDHMNLEFYIIHNIICMANLLFLYYSIPHDVLTN